MTLQRLFVFLSESRRSFVSIDSVAKVLLGESDFSFRSSDELIEKIGCKSAHVVHGSALLLNGSTYSAAS